MQVTLVKPTLGRLATVGSLFILAAFVTSYWSVSPVYVYARRSGPVREPDWTLGRWGSPAMLVLAFLAMGLMAAGSLLGA